MAAKKSIKIKRSPYVEYVIMLCVLALVSLYYYGGRVLGLLAAGVVSAVAAELIAAAVTKKNKDCIFDFNAIFTGAAIAMMLPATASAALAAAGAVFAIVVAKLPFGSTLKTPFVPAAAGMAFLTVCFPDKVFDYPPIDASQGGTSLSAMLNSGGALHLNTVRAFSILSGNIPGAMGTCCAIALIGCCAFFAVMRPKNLCNIAGFVLVCAALALIFPRGSFSRLASLLTELCAGSLLFSAVFFVTDPATSPKNPLLRFFYGALAGALCMLLRYFGAFEEGTCFGILLLNAVWPVADSALRKLGVYKLADRQRLKHMVRKNSKLAANAPAQGGEQ